MKRIVLLVSLSTIVISGAAAAQPTSPFCHRHHRVAFSDEYGFRYDNRGDRLNAQGCVIAPPHTVPGARVIQD